MAARRDSGEGMHRNGMYGKRVGESEKGQNESQAEEAMNN
jgi:hypothetical protein